MSRLQSRSDAYLFYVFPHEFSSKKETAQFFVDPLVCISQVNTQEYPSIMAFLSIFHYYTK